MKNLTTFQKLGLGLALIGVLGFFGSICNAGYYLVDTDTIVVTDEDSPFDVAHEYAHRIFFTELSPGQRNRWTRLFTEGSLNWTYSTYPLTYSDPHRRAVEAFADIATFLDGYSLPKGELQYWYNEDYTQSKEYKMVTFLLNK